MFEYGQKYKRGPKTLFFMFIQKGWWLTLIGVGFILASYLMYFGVLNEPLTAFLLQHPDWYLTPGMLSLWSVLIGLSCVFVAYLRANVSYRHYKFMLDEYALYLHRGLFFIKETTIPYKHISNVHIERPYHYRMFGIAKLDIVTTAHSNPNHVDANRKLLIPIIDLSVARALSKFLLQGSTKPLRKPRHTEDFLEEDIIEEDESLEADDGDMEADNENEDEFLESDTESGIKPENDMADDLFSDDEIDEFDRSIRM